MYQYVQLQSVYAYWVTCRNSTIGPNKWCSHCAMNVWFKKANKLGCLEWSLKPWSIHNTFFHGVYSHTEYCTKPIHSWWVGKSLALPEHKRCSILDVVSPVELLLHILQQTWGWFGGQNWTSLKPSWFMELQNDFCICLVGMLIDGVRIKLVCSCEWICSSLMSTATCSKTNQTSEGKTNDC